MEEARLIEWLVELHQGLPRLGPGDAGSTRRALALCAGLPPAPEILDIGCGTGAQTLVLAEATAGHILATDLFAVFLNQLEARVRERGLEQRIRTQVADMRELPFADGRFDLLWSEGAIYLMGFDAGLTAWRRLLRPGGYLVVSELSWFSVDPPAEPRHYWQRGYPAMRRVEENLVAAVDLGWQPVGHFTLPSTAWTQDYYGPLNERLPGFRRAHAGEAEALAVADQTEEEMRLMGRWADVCGYAFYVLRRLETATG